MEFLCTVNQDYLEHWRGLSRDGLLPKASSFLPEDVPTLLPYFAIYELVSREYIKIRLAGSLMVRRHGMDNTGANYLDFVSEERKPEASNAFWEVATHPCGMRVIVRHTFSTGLTVEVEALGLPMENDKGPNPVLYYTVCDLERDWATNMPEIGKTKRLGVLQREFLDIGAGVPNFANQPGS